MNEAHARIKINKLLEEAGWRFFDSSEGKANIQLETTASLTQSGINALGSDFENVKNGKIDFLLLNEKGFPLLVLEAKAESKDPLDGKEQARKYARSQNCRFVILSNGNLHYFWDLVRGNPYLITTFPTPESVTNYKKVTPDPGRLVDEPVGADYIALTQRPNYATEAGYINEAERPGYIAANKLRFLRPYQIRGLQALQREVKAGNDRFLFEMATGTGKTLLSAAVIKLFLRTSNASRVLFLVDRLELEEQARKNFVAYLKDDYHCVVYKEKRKEWRKAEIVVSTVQSLQFNNRYRQVFSPTDFDLVVSDEAHRSIGGNARAVFDYFVGYKLGLTATPRDYLRKFDSDTATSPREHERRLLLDTYKTFGCDGGQPTFRYSLVDGVKDGYLIPPTVVDARTDITTKLLAEEGYVVNTTDENGNETEDTYKQRQFEKKFFSDATNALFCKTFLEHALPDPVTGELGKSIVFAVSQNHASKITQLLNQMADKLYPGKYKSDFAVQVTSRIPDAQQFTINFANNNLLGNANFNPAYKTSKARVCVTVGMMTTGYDCPDLLNLALMRPVFSPTDFVQIKGRGTRKHDFREQALDDDLKQSITNPEKTAFKLFDFFGNCEYFEHEFNYDEVIPLPKPGGGGEGGGEGPGPGPGPEEGGYEYTGEDILSNMTEQLVGPEGMKIDRMYFQKFEDAARADAQLAHAVEQGRWDEVIDQVNDRLFNKPNEFYTLDKLRKAAAVDRRISLREILEKVFGLIPSFKSRDQLLEEEFDKFITQPPPPEPPVDPNDYAAIKTYFKAYASSDPLRHIIESRELTKLFTFPGFGMADYRAVPEVYRDRVPEYIKDYVSLNQFL